jgi:hypothetical protein
MSTSALTLSPPEQGRASKVRTAFRLECGVRIAIAATPERIWSLLTNAADFPRWNSTVSTLEGTIALGQRIKLTVPIAPGRTFKLKVSVFEPGLRMVWRDGMAPMFKGVRTFTLERSIGGWTVFSMVEVFSGLMLPLIAKALPDFGPSFEEYARDLKAEAERG